MADDSAGDKLAAALSEIHVRRGPVALLLHGCSAGVDRWAHRWAVSSGVACAVHHQGLNGRAASPTQMLELEKPDLVLCFPGGRGTANVVRLARARGIQIEMA